MSLMEELDMTKDWGGLIEDELVKEYERSDAQKKLDELGRDHALKCIRAGNNIVLSPTRLRAVLDSQTN
jgi:hypothetical protein